MAVPIDGAERYRVCYYVEEKKQIGICMGPRVSLVPAIRGKLLKFVMNITRVVARVIRQ